MTGKGSEEIIGSGGLSEGSASEGTFQVDGP